MRRVQGIVLFLLLAGTMVAAQAPDGAPPGQAGDGTSAHPKGDPNIAPDRRNYDLTMKPIGTGHLTTTLVGAQPGNGTANSTGVDQSAVMIGPGIHSISNPVADVRNNRSWEYGPFANWGTGVGDRSDYKFFWAGFQVGKILSPVVHAGIFSGQFEYGGEIMPLWQAYTPPPHTVQIECETSTGQLYPCPWQFGGGTFTGVSIMPVIFKWNFLTRSRRIQPWFQAAGGLIYTTHKFPPNYMSNNDPAKGPIIDAGTSVWNFMPQGGFGVHYFLKSRRSIDVGVNAVHISSASLGDRNPGVNASIQIQAGYTFWK
ncbi:MAG: acyloxyacyl hydrolase [Terracidiphilus sp.]